MGKVNPVVKRLKDQIKSLEYDLFRERDYRIRAEAKLEQIEKDNEINKESCSVKSKAIQSEVEYLRELVSNITLDQYKITAIADAKVKLMEADPSYYKENYI